jgi:hypothetical protein
MKQSALYRKGLTHKDRSNRKERNKREGEKQLKHKKIGAESSDPNRRSQPRLPGSVVGKPSMRRTDFPGKITEVNVPK